MSQLFMVNFFAVVPHVTCCRARNWIVSYTVHPIILTLAVELAFVSFIFFWNMHRDTIFTFFPLGYNFLSRKAFRHNTAGLPDYSWQRYWTRKVASTTAWLSLDLQRSWLLQVFQLINMNTAVYTSQTSFDQLGKSILQVTVL